MYVSRAGLVQGYLGARLLNGGAKITISSILFCEWRSSIGLAVLHGAKYNPRHRKWINDEITHNWLNFGHEYLPTRKGKIKSQIKLLNHYNISPSLQLEQA
jgi:hypothetical protein